MGDRDDPGTDLDFAAESRAGFFKGVVQGRVEGAAVDPELRQRAQVVGDDFVDGPMVGAEESLAGEAGAV